MNLKDLVTALENAAENIWEEIEEAVEAAAPTVIEYAESFLEHIASVALQAVLTEWDLVKSGQEKFGTAVTHVLQQAEITGVSMALNDAHMVVQAAYNKVASAKTGN